LLDNVPSLLNRVDLDGGCRNKQLKDC